ncbi:tellurite resistance TerB family protein [Pseudohongiella sp.]|uniref:Tellurite resistance TerB family protein n=1 Tax=marine sediment metagenome TaxID=412755 RepID=A0A0F9Z0L2_9ZZZZ|nr:tellurite resistance TerB family protein [Pseudohongiella sp.]HDZ09836.1 tellurite resistance TerB family protein [Pseudohongiella sp.]HEA61550.1 tellurite resistance TerB family protein [Pseudohongiella sp.]
MIDPNRFLEQFMGGNSGAGQGAQKPASSGGGFAKGAVAGGVLGLLVGNKKVRKMGGGMLAYGGAAAAGAMAFKAYQNWQQGKQVTTAPVATENDMQHVDSRFLPQQTPRTASGGSFSLTLIMAMISAAKADGHIDAKEQTHIFEQVEKMSLDAESKGFVFDALRQPADMAQLASGVQGIEQAAEVYLVSRSVLDVDHPAERAYLQALAHRLDLPADLVAHLDHQVTGE